MKVWILSGGSNHEGATLLGVFATEELAWKKQAESEKDRGCSYDHYDVAEFDVQGIQEPIKVGDKVKIGPNPFWHTIGGERDDYYEFDTIGQIGIVVANHVDGDLRVEFDCGGFEYYCPTCVTKVEEDSE